MIENKKQKVAAAMIRRSSHKQKGNDSFEIQLSHIKDYAKAKGLLLPSDNIFYDDGVSAFKKNANERKGLNKLKDAILTRNIDAVIFYDFSRIDRKIYSFVSEFYNDVIAKKPEIKFYTTTKYDNWTPADFDVKIHLIVANGESHNKARHAVDSQISALVNENRPGSVVPFGYDQVNKKLVPNKDAPIVRFIYHLASWGHSVKKIAHILNDAEVPSPSNKRWNGSTIDVILKNPVYLGTLEWKFHGPGQGTKKCQSIQNAHTPIVPHFLKKIIDANRTFKKEYSKLETPFIYSGLLICTNCSNSLSHRNASTGKGENKYSYLKYYCHICNYEIEAISLNKLLLDRMDTYFAFNSSIIRDKAISIIDACLFELYKNRKVLHDKQKLIEINESTIANNRSNLNIVFKNVKARLANQIKSLNDKISDIELLKEEKQLESIIMQLQDTVILNLSNTEQRLFTLYSIDQVLITKRNDNTIDYDIKFRQNPLSLINDSTG
ncbi:recombinase family protein [Bacillus sp. HMF5848]|uniref:recombinase family protein n=1 Tax=Bacillus sp. HMF5848 TaxID=2495421 RepID=UPI000F7BAE48|nr:recombinase family protein [Bacillus sp. HMF5848]RSK26542.1 recombinase family protein [Bacillus sp. HMF5848]